MPSVALADLLPDFGPRLKSLDPHRAPAPEPLAVEPEIDIAGLIAAEVAEAEARTTERISQIYEDTLQAERDKHAAELASIEAQLGANAGQTIGREFSAMEARVSSLATDATARILGLILSEDLQKRSVDSLARAMSEALRDADAVRVRVRGPQSLFDSLQAALGERAPNVEFTETTAFDLSVDIDGNLFETRLSEWSTAVAEVLS